MKYQTMLETPMNNKALTQQEILLSKRLRIEYERYYETSPIAVFKKLVYDTMTNNEEKIAYFSTETFPEGTNDTRCIDKWNLLYDKVGSQIYRYKFKGRHYPKVVVSVERQNNNTIHLHTIWKGGKEDWCNQSKELDFIDTYNKCSDAIGMENNHIEPVRDEGVVGYISKHTRRYEGLDNIIPCPKPNWERNDVPEENRLSGDDRKWRSDLISLSQVSGIRHSGGEVWK